MELLNFRPIYIKVSGKAFKEMNWMKTWKHSIHPTAFSLMYFTERTSNWVFFRSNDSYGNNGKLFHKYTGHGLVICYETAKIFFVEEFPIISLIETLRVLFRTGDTRMLNFFIM